MVRISTLFHRVDGFHESDSEPLPPDLLDLHTEDSFLSELLGPLLYDPGEELVRAVLQKA